MRIYNRSTLNRFCETQKSKPHYAALKSQVKQWYHEASQAKWASTAEIKARYATASIITAERVVFNLVSNHYRLIVKIDFDWSIIFVCFIGTHKEYDKVDARSVEYGD